MMLPHSKAVQLENRSLFPGGIFFSYLPIIPVVTWPLAFTATVLLLLRLVTWFKIVKTAGWSQIWNILGWALGIVAQGLNVSSGDVRAICSGDPPGQQPLTSKFRPNGHSLCTN